MYSGTGLFSRKPPPSPIAPTTSSPHRATPGPSPTAPISPTSAAASTNDSSSAEPRRRHGSAPLANAFGLMRRDSVPASTSSAANSSRRSLTADAQHTPARKMSEPVIHKPSPLSPKRKPLPKGSAFDKQTPDDAHDLKGKLGKMDLTNGSTMIVGKCMCCDSNLRFPTSVTCYRCTVCVCVNDLKPNQPRQGFQPVPMTLETLESLIPKPAPDTPATYEDLEEHLIKTFSTFESLNESFLNGRDSSIQDPGVDLDAVRAFYQRLRELPTASSLFLSLIKTSEVLLRRPGRPLKRKEDLRFLLIVLENPALGINFFNSFPGLHQPSPTKIPPSPTKPISTIPKRVSLDERRASKVIEPQSPIGDGPTNSTPSPTKDAAHPRQVSAPVSSLSSDAQHTQHSLMKRLYGIISNLPNELHHYLVNWFARLLSPAIFRRRVEMINSFIAYRLGKHQKRALLSGPSGAPKVQRQLYTNDWQIKASARMMALFFAANTNRPKIQLSEFYNTLVDYCDLITDFDTWELKFGKFSFCQYPFLLSMGAKMNIMEYDARRQMEIKAREAFFTTVFQKRTVAPHLILKVRRDCIIEDSLTQISCNEMDVKKGLRIEFVGEDGVDAGGLRKEWFLLLCREVFDPLYGMFTWDEDSKYCWFNPNSFETSDQFFLVGVVLGLAIYNSTILDIHLPLACYKKLLGVHCGLEDLKTFKPAVANSLEKLLAYEGDDFEQVFGLDFVTQKEGYGQMETVDLVPGGSRKPVTKANRHEYVRRYTEYLLDTSISKQFEPFKRGFYHVCGGNALSLFRPEEIELLIRGSPEKLDVDQLRAVAVYEGENSRVPISENEPVIRWFWSFFARMDPLMQRKLLTFVTGSDRIPATGVANLAFKISILGDSETRFPIAHTCFNQLCIYRYRSRARLEKMLTTALEESEGFGLK